MKKYIPIFGLLAIAIIAFCMIPQKTTFKAGVSDDLIGQYRCEKTASDKKTDTSFYSLTIENDGNFSLYDTVGNPGISGMLGNQKKERIIAYCKDDFDPPSCWKFEKRPQGIEFDYKYKEGKLKLGYQGIWLSFTKEQ